MGAELRDLAGRTVLVTGASKGIGQEIARAVGAGGAHVIAHYGADLEGARTAVADVSDGRRLVLGADLSVPGQARRLWQEALAWQGRIDVLVSNAAVLIESPVAGPEQEWDDVWNRTLEVNLRATADLVRDAIAHFTATGGGVIVALGSSSGQAGSGNRNLLAYTASKGAIASLMHTVARTYAKDGVLAYLVAPGLVRTQMSAGVGSSRGGEEAVTASLPMREWVPPSEIGDLVAFLATGRQRHLTGATFDVNGASYIR